MKLFSKIKALIKAIFEKKGIRFLFVGGLNTLVGYGTYALFIFLDLDVLLAQTFSTIIGTIHSYFWNKYFTFKSKKKSLPEFIRFILVYVVVFGIGLLNIYILVDLLHVNEYIAGAINTVINIVISWFGHNFFSFKRKKETIENNKIDGGDIDNNNNNEDEGFEAKAEQN